MERIQRLIRYLTDHQIQESIPIFNWSIKRAIYEGPSKYKLVPDDTHFVNNGDWLVDSGTTMFLEKEVLIRENWRNHQNWKKYMMKFKDIKKLRRTAIGRRK